MCCDYTLESVETEIVRWVPKPGVRISASDDSDKIAIRATDRRINMRIQRVLVSVSWLLNGARLTRPLLSPRPLFPEALATLTNQVPRLNHRAELVLHFLQHYFQPNDEPSEPMAVDKVAHLIRLLESFNGFADRRLLLDDVCRHHGLEPESYWHVPAIMKYFLVTAIRDRSSSADRQRFQRTDIQTADLVRLSWDGATIKATPEMLQPDTAYDQATAVFLKWQRGAHQ
jgi:hypothetical protein